MKTLIVLYDGIQMNNVITAAHIQPDQIIVIFPKELKASVNEKELNELMDMTVTYIPFDLNDPVRSLRTVLEPYKGAYVDSCGGHDYAAMILGSLMDEYDFTIVSPYQNRHVIAFYNHGVERIETLISPEITIPEFVAMSDGKVISSQKPDTRGDKKWALVDFCNRQRRNLPDRWRLITKFIQQNLNNAEAKNSLVIREDQHRSYKDMLKELVDEGILEPRESRQKSFMNYYFTSDFARELLAVEGKSLEEEVWRQLYESNLYTDVREQVRIDWNGENYVATHDPTSELDVVATKEWFMVCISCKSGKLKEEALYEVFSNAHRFGQGKPIPVVCHDSKDETVILNNKASELGIIMVNQTIIESGKTAEYIYDKINHLKW